MSRPPQPPRVALRPGLCSVTYRALPPAAVIELARAAGLAGIEWGGDVHVPPGDTARAHEVRRLTEAAGLAIVAYGSYLRPPEDDAAGITAVLRTAEALGAPGLRVWPGRRGVPSARYGEDERRAAVAAIAALTAQARGAGLHVALEYHPDTLTDELASAARLLDEVDDPDLHLYWQPRPGLPLGEALTEVDRLGPRLAHLHVFQWDAAKRRFPLRDGAGFWPAVLGALQPSTWPGQRWALLEFVPDDAPDALAVEAATLRAWLGAG